MQLTPAEIAHFAAQVEQRPAGPAATGEVTSLAALVAARRARVRGQGQRANG